MLRNYLFILIFIGLSSLAYPYKWHRGLYQFDSVEKVIQFTKYGESPTWLSPATPSLKSAQLAKFSANDSASLFLSMSAGILGKWKGPGKFSIEAFDHKWIESTSSFEPVNELTRTILYLERGLLFIDAVALTENSFIVVETPLGKVIAFGGIFSVKIEELLDDAKRNLVIECYQGNLEYTDKKGAPHSLSGGEKILIIFKDGLFKTNTVELDELEINAVSNFKKERALFSNAVSFPKIEKPLLLDRDQENAEIYEVNDNIKNSYYLPILKHIKAFNPYKKSYGDH